MKILVKKLHIQSNSTGTVFDRGGKTSSKVMGPLALAAEKLLFLVLSWGH